MSLTFGWETCEKVFQEPNFFDLLNAHYAELAVPGGTPPRLDPDFPRYVELERLGLFRIWTARDGKTLVGYIGWYTHPHLHHRGKMVATDELYLLSAPYRRGLNGYLMFKTALVALKKLGAFRVIIHSKTHFERERGGLARFFTKLGLSHTDDIWTASL